MGCLVSSTSSICSKDNIGIAQDVKFNDNPSMENVKVTQDQNAILCNVGDREKQNNGGKGINATKMTDNDGEIDNKTSLQQKIDTANIISTVPISLYDIQSPPHINMIPLEIKSLFSDLADYWEEIGYINDLAAPIVCSNDITERGLYKDQFMNNGDNFYFISNYVQPKIDPDYQYFRRIDTFDDQAFVRHRECILIMDDAEYYLDYYFGRLMNCRFKIKDREYKLCYSNRVKYVMMTGLNVVLFGSDTYLDLRLSIDSNHNQYIISVYKNNISHITIKYDDDRLRHIEVFVPTPLDHDIHVSSIHHKLMNKYYIKGKLCDNHYDIVLNKISQIRDQNDLDTLVKFIYDNMSSDVSIIRDKTFDNQEPNIRIEEYRYNNQVYGRQTIKFITHVISGREKILKGFDRYNEFEGELWVGYWVPGIQDYSDKIFSVQVSKDEYDRIMKDIDDIVRDIVCFGNNDLTSIVGEYLDYNTRDI